MILWSDLTHPRLLQQPVMPMPALGYPPGPMDDEDCPDRGGFVSSTKPGTHTSALRRAPDGVALTREVELLEGLAMAGADVRERARVLYWRLRMLPWGSADLSDPNAPRDEHGVLVARVEHLMGGVR